MRVAESSAALVSRAKRSKVDTREISWIVGNQYKLVSAKTGAGELLRSLRNHRDADGHCGGFLK